MTWLILLAVGGMLIGSLAWLMPSPREQQQMTLRQTATRLGLHTKIVDLPSVIDESRAQPMHCIAYSLQRSTPSAGAGWQVARDRIASQGGPANAGLPAGWYWASGDVPSVVTKNYLNNTLPSLHDDILAVESTPYSCMIYWRERGGVGQVESIANTLKALIALNDEYRGEET